MKRLYYLISLIGLIAAAFASGVLADRTVDLVFDVQANENVVVNHKSFTGFTISGTVTDSVAEAAIDISGKTGTVGFKTDLSSTSFWAETTITVTDGPAGQFTATFPASQWRTNNVVKERFYGDLRLSDFGNTLPSIELWLNPSANTGAESQYISPAVASFETNSVTVDPPANVIDFRNGFDYSYDGQNLRLDVVPAAVDDTVLNHVTSGNGFTTNTLWRLYNSGASSNKLQVMIWKDATDEVWFYLVNPSGTKSNLVVKITP